MKRNDLDSNYFYLQHQIDGKKDNGQIADHYHFGTKLSPIKGKDMLIIQKIEMLTIIISFRK